MLVMGVDPGSRITGYGLVDKRHGHMTHLDSGCIRSHESVPFYDRIHRIFVSMVDIMERFKPDEMAVEDVFYAKNVKSSLKLGHARGAVLIAAVQCGVRIHEYSALEIKKSVVGYGRATKEQVGAMVKVILKLETVPDPDAADALAAAICHTNWAQFQSARLRSPAQRK
jgi:crossover junction endodeoxyribonuclease RuvC